MTYGRNRKKIENNKEIELKKKRNRKRRAIKIILSQKLYLPSYH